MNFANALSKMKKADYRHYLCVGAILVSLAFGVLFPNAIPRLAEAIRDLLVSIGYYFCGLFVDLEDIPFSATVTEPSTWQFAASPFKPFWILPFTWEEFKVLLADYGKLLISAENLKEYLFFILEKSVVILQVFSMFFMIAVASMGILVLVTGGKNNNADVDSRALSRFKRLLFRTAYPVRAWLRSFIEFLCTHKRYPILFLAVWAFHFNLFAIAVSVFAYYFYFAISADLIGLYKQLIKLLWDITPIVQFIPFLVWLLVGYILFEWICRRSALDKLHRHEEHNEQFVRETGVNTIIYGDPGVGKTSFCTSIALTAENVFAKMH